MGKKIMLSKYFNRSEEDDFSDDGNFFRAYRSLDGIRVTICRSGGEIFLAARMPEGLIDYDIKNLDEEYFKLCAKASKCCDRFNGVYTEPADDELAAWDDDLHYYVAELTKYNKPKPTIYYNTLDEKYYGHYYEYSPWGSTIQKTLKPIYVNKDRQNKFNIKYLVIADVANPIFVRDDLKF